MGINRESDQGGIRPMPSSAEVHSPSSLKWGQDGELSAVDLQGILARLSAVDQQAAMLMNCPLDP